MLLLQIADDVTATHVRVLTWIGSDGWAVQLKRMQDQESTLDELIRQNFTGEEVVVIQGIIADLVAGNLLANRSTYFGLSTMNPEKISDLGRAFLEFISKGAAPMNPRWIVVDSVCKWVASRRNGRALPAISETYPSGEDIFSMIAANVASRLGQRA